MSWLSSIAGEASNAFNSQPTWAKGLEIGGAAALTGGAALGLAGIGPAAGLFGELGGATAGAEAAGTLGAAGTAGAGIDFGTSTLAGLSDFGSLGGLAGGASGAAGAGADALALAGPETSTLAGAPAEQGITTALASAPGAGGAAPAAAGPVDLASTVGIDNVAATLGGTGSSAAGGGGSSFLSGLGLGDITAKSLIGPAIAAGGLGYSVYNQNKTEAQQNAAIQGFQNQEQANVAAANTAAAPTLQAGETLMQYLQTGTLPPNVQAQLQQSTAAAKARAIANAAQNGTSTDPAQNTALAQQLASIDQQAQVTSGNLEQQLFQSGQQAVGQANQLIASGLNSSGMQAQLQQYLITLDNNLSLQTGQAITKFAASLAPQGGAQKYTLQAA